MARLTLEQFARENGYLINNDWLLQALFYGTDTDFARMQTTTELHLLSQNKYDKLIENIVNENNIAHFDAFLKLISLLAKNVGDVTHLRKITKELQINVHTAERYLDILLRHNVIFALTGYHKKREDELHNYSKYYFANQALLTQVLDIKPGGNISSKTTGVLWHNLCISEKWHTLQKERDADSKVELFYWQTYGKLTYDLIIQDKTHHKTTAYNCRYLSAELAGIAPLGSFSTRPIAPLSLWNKTYPRHRTFQVSPRCVLSFLG